MSVAQTHSRSIDFLLEKAGPVIRYRLQKELLQNLSPSAEEALLEQITRLPAFQLVQSYVKPDGYIGRGMHSWDHWRGQTLHETPFQDGECAARLLSYYRIPQTHPMVSNFVAALRDEAILREEFSYIPPEIPRFEKRFLGLNSGNCLMALIYTLQAMLGYGDDIEELRGFQEICLQGFRQAGAIASLEEITHYNPRLKRKYNVPYIEADTYFPNLYTLATLAYTRSWRTRENIDLLARSLNHINAVMKPDNEMQIRIAGKFSGPCFALARPLRPFDVNVIDTIAYRRPLSEIAMTGAGDQVEIIRQSVTAVEEALQGDGILRMNLQQPHNKRYSPLKLPPHPTAYTDVRLETEDSSPTALACDLTFWAVELLFLVERGGFA